jgi:MoxR-like ATPase
MTTARVQPNREQMEHAYGVVNKVAKAFGAKVVGQAGLQESLMIGLLTSGHVLVEGVPGLAKTTAARVLADAIQGTFRRIQCTPDLLPSDILGTQIYDTKTNSFVAQLGPVHANIVLLDEVNRSSAKTQSAMLEAMEERQTTVGGEVHRLPEPFLVVATQNPVDQEGTYPLSEAQSDRFLLKDIIRYPTPQEEAEVVFRIDAGVYDGDGRVAPVVTLDEVRQLQSVVRDVHMDPVLVHYITQLVGATREPGRFLNPQLARLVEYGASPRASIAFSKSARALALLSGRNHVVPDDIKRLAHRVLRHRLILGFEADAVEVTPEIVIDAVLQSVRVP